VTDHYFSTDPRSTDARTAFDADLWGHRVSLQSASGVFSHGRLDAGTQVLARAAEPRPHSRAVLDLGCGTGALAVGLALTVTEATVWAVDVNERALALTRANAEACEVADRLHVVTPDEVPAAVRFDEIWSNPPIRIGKAAVRELLLGWLARLADSGRAVLVIGRNLGADSYQRWLREQGFDCERLASAKGFRVLEVTGCAAAGPL
jgi:16S rRNA (guanine1207-N2)-methyltransferase